LAATLAGQIIQPAVITDRLDRQARTASVCDLTFTAIHTKLVDWRDEHGPHPYRDGQISAADVRRWRASAADRDGFQRLVRRGRHGPRGDRVGLEVSRLAHNNADWQPTPNWSSCWRRWRSVSRHGGERR
jgi:hypothetical protein